MSSIEWLEQQLTYQYEGQTLNKFYDWKDISEIYNKAKEMHKQEIIDAYWGGLNGSINDYSKSKQIGSEIINIKYGKGAEHYYNETYGSKGSDDINPLTSNLVDYQNPSNMSDNIKQFSLYEHKETITSADTITSSQTEISDEEIEKMYSEEDMINYAIWFTIESNSTSGRNRTGKELLSEWYREQLKNLKFK